MRRTGIIILIIVALLMLSSCSSVDTRNNDEPEELIDHSIPSESEPLSTVAKDTPPYIRDIPLDEDLEEPTIKNGASFLFEWHEGVLYADNLNLIWHHADGGIIRTNRKPMFMDIYKNRLYYMEDQSTGLYEVNLDTLMESLVFSDILGSMFLIAEDAIFYVDTDWNLCSRDLQGANKKILSKDIGVGLKYKDGWLYYTRDVDDVLAGKLYRRKTDGSQEETVINEDIYYFYLTENSIVYQIGVGKEVHVKELNDDGNTVMIMVDELASEELVRYGQFQLIKVENGSVYYYKDTKEEFSVYKYQNGETFELTDLYVDNTVFSIVMIGDNIYCYASNEVERGLFRISKDGSSSEKIGENYRVPKYLLE